VRPRVAVLQLPGVNGEEETVLALRHAGLHGEVAPWTVSRPGLRSYDAYVLPGGFSYQDRVRAGAVAARSPLIDVIVARAAEGAPVLGICNGAQILVESGLVPGDGNLGLALAPNRMPERDGYLARWVWCEIGETRCLFTRAYAPGERVPLPVAHGEGRFTSQDEGAWERWQGRGQLALRYSPAAGRRSGTEDGEPLAFPANPNGAAWDCAGLCNEAGNVLAMMPHPERVESLFQVPIDLPGEWGSRRRQADDARDLRAGAGPGRGIFLSLAMHLGVAETQHTVVDSDKLAGRVRT
jgi:phosphoribosylformylglycinamidine synthase I